MNVQNNKGFSLVELMVVVAIIGILAAVGIPQFSKFQARSRQSEAKAHLSGIYTAEKGFSAEFSSFYGGLRTIGYGPDNGGSAASGLRYNAGFSAVGAIPPNVTAAAGDAPSLFVAASTICQASGVAVLCVRSPALSAVPAIPASIPGVTTFTAHAFGNPNSRTTTAVDRWTIDQDKTLTWAANGID